MYVADNCSDILFVDKEGNNLLVCLKGVGICTWNYASKEQLEKAYEKIIQNIKG